MPDQKHNAFISYAWVDNQTFDEDKGRGWVDIFVKRLDKHLRRELPREFSDQQPWLDYERIGGNDIVSDKIRKKLESCPLLVPIVSKSYRDSPWCQQELEIFLELHGPKSRRIFPVWMSPAGDLPDVLDALLKYQFWYKDAANRTRTRWFPDIDASDREYGHMQQDMAREMAKRFLEALGEEGLTDAGSPTAKPTTPKPSAGGRLVLVNGGDEDAGLVREIMRRLSRDHHIDAAAPLSILPGKSNLRSSTITRDLREKLKLCSDLLIVFKDGPAHQIDGQIIEYLKVTPQRRKDRPRPTLRLCRPNGVSREIGVHPAGMVEHIWDSDCATDCIRKLVGSLQ